MRIFITRHGETIWNTKGKMQGHLNSPLTEKGVKNAEKLNIHLKNIKFDKVYCSPLGRAVETANILVKEKNNKVEIIDNLSEMNFGCWEGMTHTEVKEIYAEEHYNFWNKPELYTPIDGESFDELIARAKSLLTDITNSCYENVLLVSHAILVRALYYVMKNYNMKEFCNPPFIEGTSLTIVEYKNNKFTFLKEASTEHLSSIYSN